MKIELGLRMIQEQRLLLLPQMLQAIEILQLSAGDLLSMVEQELAENETLELATDEQGEQEDEADWRQEYHDEAYFARPSRDSFEDQDPMAQIPAGSLSLSSYLLRQVALLDLAGQLRETLSFLIGSLDRNGHLGVSEEELHAILGEDEPIAEAIWVLRGLDPVGIGQVGPKESMLAQLDPDDPDHGYLELLINEQLDALAKNKMPKVAKALGLSVAAIGGLIEKLRVLEPCPGKSFQNLDVETLAADVVVRREDGEWQVYVEDARVPPLRIRAEYAAMAKDKRSSAAVKSYLKGKLGSARDLLASIEQRKTTLGRVARAIVDRQKGFLEKGLGGLKPLKMQDVADAVGVHLSTVSRAIAHKNVQTDFGIFPLRRLFDGGKAVGAENGAGGEARVPLQERLRRLIEAEDKSRPYSDDRLVELLSAQSLKIARRTVAKYRKELGIPSSWRRKKY